MKNINELIDMHAESFEMLIQEENNNVINNMEVEDMNTEVKVNNEVTTVNGLNQVKEEFTQEVSGNAPIQEPKEKWVQVDSVDELDDFMSQGQGGVFDVGVLPQEVERRNDVKIYKAKHRIPRQVLEENRDKIADIFMKTLGGLDPLCPTGLSPITPERALQTMLVRGTITQEMYTELTQKTTIDDVIESIVGFKSVYSIVAEEGEDALKNVITEEEVTELRESAANSEDFKVFFITSLLPVLIKYDEEKNFNRSFGTNSKDTARRRRQYLTLLMSVYFENPIEVLISYVEFCHQKENSFSVKGLRNHFDYVTKQQKKAKAK